MKLLPLEVKFKFCFVTLTLVFLGVKTQGENVQPPHDIGSESTAKQGRERFIDRGNVYLRAK